MKLLWIIISSLVVIVLLAAIALLIGGVFVASEPDWQYCTNHSYDDCPEDRCEVSASCPVCADIGCYPKGHYEREMEALG